MNNPESKSQDLWLLNNSVEIPEWGNLSESQDRLLETALELTFKVGHPTVSYTRDHNLKYVTNIKNETYFRVLKIE
jgi:hypothetical protein